MFCRRSWTLFAHDIPGFLCLDLGLRVGLHSGAVTGGVLREGERSRFQIFGETVHTALFVERTGLSGKIQASQETASLLVAGGKESLLTRRPKKIIFKGKVSQFCIKKEACAFNP